ncbi:hypothetical protein AVEN_173185-1 [Araneus ventricosus]|uniref:Pre-C2HC domain-containing protein n=1 Tax=Araneus ventricosus TaxID=182803 RepID=A0A4Y2RN59_ARAVE|nr:hypothetical protein AVEN_173185-1 [Araneus ventricosus]
MVSPRKAVREIHLEKEATPIKTANMFSQIGEQEIPKVSPRSIPEINLNVTSSSNLIIKEICQLFPNIENRLRKEFIGIRTDTEENRDKIISLLKEKNLEFVPREAFENRPMKLVIRNLPKEMDQK